MPKRSHKHQDPHEPKFLASPLMLGLEPECRIRYTLHTIYYMPYITTYYIYIVYIYILYIYILYISIL